MSNSIEIISWNVNEILAGELTTSL